ncbi:MAG TPA: PqqD family peptide modification chaperone, partial [Anaerolineaceae bacterium]
MNRIFRLWERIFPPIQPLPAGIYQCQMPSGSALPYRLHLRIDQSGQGILIVNASTVFHLNQTAAEYVYHLVQNTPEDDAVAAVARRYNVRKEIILRDYHNLLNRIRTTVQTPDLDPEVYLDFNRDEPYTGAVSAPYRLDCALTYRLPDEGGSHYAPLERVARELVSDEWKTILEKAWNAGVPHAIFTGGEPTMRPDLPELIAYGEKLGMVTGLITNGLRLAESKYLHELLQSGLDHIMILLDPQEDQSWEAVRDTLAEDIALTVHVTLSQRNLDKVDALIGRLAQMGVKNLSLSADSMELKDALREHQKVAAENHLRLVWDLPVPYSQMHPVAVELAE